MCNKMSENDQPTNASIVIKVCGREINSYAMTRVVVEQLKVDEGAASKFFFLN